MPKIDAVRNPSAAYRSMEEAWRLISDLRGGTTAMRAAGERWLPKEPRERARAWESRLCRSYLYGALKNTIEKVVSKPFSKPVTLQGELPEKLSAIELDTDFHGKDLTQFAREVFDAGVAFGLTHIFVDFPAISGAGRTLDDDRNLRIHPYFRHISPPDLIGWKSEVDPRDRRRKLTQIRIRETGSETKNEFEEVSIETVLVWDGPLGQRGGTWRRFKKVEDEWIVSEEGTHTYPGVPLVTFYTEETGFLLGEPPLEDLAWLNIAHWQSLSDQRNILRFARLPILFQTGITDEEINKPLTLGPTNTFRSTNPEAKMFYVEHSGKAIESGEMDLVRLEERMEVLGLQPFMQNRGSKTATEISAGEGRHMTSVQCWIRSAELTFEQAYLVAGIWAFETVPDDFKVDIFSEFGIGAKSDSDLRILQVDRARGDLTHHTYLSELKRRAVLSENVDIEAEVKEAENEVMRVDDDFEERDAEFESQTA